MEFFKLLFETFNEGLLTTPTIPVHILLVILCIAVSYLLGSINSAIIVSKVLYKDDIRKYGSGNAGLTNVLRTYGKGAAGLTFLGDMLKTAIAITFTALFFGFHYNAGISLSPGYCYMAGLFAVLGHVFPIYYGFKGGKGVLVTVTMALILSPAAFLIMMLIFVIIVAISKYVSLASVTVSMLYPLIINFYIRYVFHMPAPGPMMLCIVFLAIFIVWCHRENLKRISNRTERKISIGGKKKKENNEEQN